MTNGDESAARVEVAAGQNSVRHVLVVDDDPGIRLMVSDLLSALGFDVSIARDGRDALVQLSHGQPDLLLLDVTMPGLDGLEVLDGVRRMRLDTAVILMTGLGSEETAVNALRRGADDYLRKPLSIAELKAALQRALQSLDERRQQTALRNQINERLAAVERESLTDALTGLPNRRFLERELTRLSDTTRTEAAAFAVLMLDIDHFKQVNDTYGHQAGDQVLVHVAGILKSNIRHEDTAGRIGGEEFLVLLPLTDANGARILAEHLRQRVAAAPLEAGAERIAVTISAGAAAWHPGEDVLHEADSALYRAKNLGRNRVEAAP